MADDLLGEETVELTISKSHKERLDYLTSLEGDVMGQFEDQFEQMIDETFNNARE